jgi:hypothetical protein
MGKQAKLPLRQYSRLVRENLRQPKGVRMPFRTICENAVAKANARIVKTHALTMIPATHR